MKKINLCFVFDYLGFPFIFFFLSATGGAGESVYFFVPAQEMSLFTHLSVALEKAKSSSVAAGMEFFCSGTGKGEIYSFFAFPCGRGWREVCLQTTGCFGRGKYTRSVQISKRVERRQESSFRRRPGWANVLGLVTPLHQDKRKPASCFKPLTVRYTTHNLPYTVYSGNLRLLWKICEKLS